MSTRTKLAQAARERPRYRAIDDLHFVTPGERGMAEAHWVATSRIQANPNNPRKTMSNEAMNELADSIRAHGMLNPITVRPEDGHYVIVAGDRRFRASILVGLSEVPCIIREVSADDAFVESLLENLQREDVPPDEEAAGLLVLHTGRGWTKRQIAQAIHKSEKYVGSRIRVFEDPILAEPVRTGQMAVSTAEELLKVRDPADRSALVEDVAQGRLDRDSLRRALPRVNRRARPAVAEGQSEPNDAGRVKSNAPDGAAITQADALVAGRTTLVEPGPKDELERPGETGIGGTSTSDNAQSTLEVAAAGCAIWDGQLTSRSSGDEVIDRIIAASQAPLEALLRERPPASLAARRRLGALNKLIKDVLEALPPAL